MSRFTVLADPEPGQLILDYLQSQLKQVWREIDRLAGEVQRLQAQADPGRREEVIDADGSG